MKLLIVTFLVLSPSFVLACANKIDPSKVILFVDTNNSELEIATTEKAACARGERIVVVPKNHKEFSKYTIPMEAANRKLERCLSKPGQSCDAVKVEAQKASKAFLDFSSKQPNIDKGVKEALEEVKQSKGRLQNFTISGHDGGGSFGGNKGSFSRQELSQIMRDYQDINDVTSLLLLGCYTGTQFEVMEWKNIFPKTKLIGGYDGSAPLADRPQGHQYIADILMKEKQLSKQADEKKLQAFVNANIKGLNNLNAAMYVQCSDGSSVQEYYYGSKKSRTFKPLDIKECLEKKKELQDVHERFSKYLSGELEPPKDTQNGELRALYNKARTYEHCGEITGIFIDVNAVFNLLFYEGVKQSFGEFYKSDLAEAEKILEKLTLEEIEKNVQNELERQEKSIQEQKDLIALLENNPEEYFAGKAKELKKLQDEKDKLFKDPAYAAVRNLIVQHGTMPMNMPALPDAEFEKYIKLLNATSMYESKKSEIEWEREKPREAARSKEMTVKSMEHQLLNNRGNLEFIKSSNPKVWVPTSENLKKYSRKELMENLHNMHKIMSIGGAAGDSKKAMGWASYATSGHLQMFQNPFSWHEYTGKKVEAPPYPMPLKDFKQESEGMYNVGFGYFSSSSSGMSYGGGIVGGSGGGQPVLEQPQQ